MEMAKSRACYRGDTTSLESVRALPLCVPLSLRLSQVSFQEPEVLIEFPRQLRE
jgi:hypothetical protein